MNLRNCKIIITPVFDWDDIFSASMLDDISFASAPQAPLPTSPQVTNTPLSRSFRNKKRTVKNSEFRIRRATSSEKLACLQNVGENGPFRRKGEKKQMLLCCPMYK